MVRAMIPRVTLARCLSPMAASPSGKSDEGLIFLLPFEDTLKPAFTAGSPDYELSGSTYEGLTLDFRKTDPDHVFITAADASRVSGVVNQFTDELIPIQGTHPISSLQLKDFRMIRVFLG